MVISYDLKPSIMSCIDRSQYGFIPGSCTTLALISLDVMGGTVRALLTDYRKASDLRDNNILCQKLQRIGIKPSVFNWIVDFLRARSQRVKLHSDCFSNWKPVNAGVHQGTKLGPWQFLLMIKDLSIRSHLMILKVICLNTQTIPMFRNDIISKVCAFGGSKKNI